jgi:hypothetical protein
MSISTRFIFFFALCLALSLTASAQNESFKKGLDAITVDVVKGELEFLASDWTEGRLTGQKGNFMAADYIASMFKIYGIQPAGDFQAVQRQRSMAAMGRGGFARPEQIRTYFQNFALIQSEPGEEQEFAITTSDEEIQKTTTFAYRTDYTVGVTTTGVKINAPIVFVGYGLYDEKNGYDDFKGVDVKGKIVLRLPGFPGYRDTNSAAYKKFRPQPTQQGPPMQRAPRVNRNDRPQQLGAAAIIDVNMDRDPSMSWATNYPFRFNTDTYEGDVPLNAYGVRLTLAGDTLPENLTVVSITPRVANEIVKGTGIILSAFDDQVAKTMKPASKEIKNKTALLKTSVKSKIVQTRNVVGVIEGENPDEVIVVGGHFDHLGKVQGYIYNGADDNGSGTVGMMTIAKACAATGAKPKRTIIFAGWTGEEQGLLGSQYFVQHPYKPLKNILFDVNYDMIARNSQQDTLGVQVGLTFTEAVPMFKELTERMNKDYNIGLTLNIRSNPRPGGGSDHASFSAKDIPVMSWMAAMHDQYHQPNDQVERVNWEKMTKIIKLGFLNVWELANSQNKLGANP